MTAFDADFAAIAAAAHAYHDNKEAKAAVPVIAEWADRMVEHARKTIENNSAMLNQCLYYLQKEQTIEGGDNGGGVEEAPAVAVAPPSVPERAAAPGGGAEDAGGVVIAEALAPSLFQQGPAPFFQRCSLRFKGRAMSTELEERCRAAADKDRPHRIADHKYT